MRMTDKKEAIFSFLTFQKGFLWNSRLQQLFRDVLLEYLPPLVYGYLNRKSEIINQGILINYLQLQRSNVN